MPDIPSQVNPLLDSYRALGCLTGRLVGVPRRPVDGTRLLPACLSGFGGLCRATLLV